jgi:hypothetical protein
VLVEKRPLLKIGVVTPQVTFWQRIGIHFVHVLRFQAKLNLKLKANLTKFQERLWHGYG